MSFLKGNLMRKRFLASLCLLLSVCVGCGSQVKTETKPIDGDQPPKVAEEQLTETAAQRPSNEPVYAEPKTYEEALDAIYVFALSDPKDRTTAMRVRVNRTGLKEITHGDAPEERLSKIGYRIEDLSGDGFPELIICEISNKRENKGKRIISLYTTADDEAYLAHRGRIPINGWSRNSYYLLDNGMLYNVGSSGVAYLYQSISCLSEDGTSVKTIEELSTFPLEVKTIRSGNNQRSSVERGSHLRIYDESGNYTLEELDETETEWQLQRMREYYKSRVVEIDLIPMSEYKSSQK